MNFPAEETKSGWLTKLGGNSLRKTWKRRWFVLKGSCLYYFRSQTDQEPAGIIPLVSYNTVTHDSVVTKKSEFCIRIEKVHRSSDSVNSSNSLRDPKSPPTFIAFADTESEMHAWLTILQRRVGERNIVDIVLDRLDLTTGLGHRRKGSIGSLRSFYSRNGSVNGTSSSISSRRPSLDSLSLDAPSVDSRKSSMDSAPGQNSDGAASQQSSRSATPNSLVATFGLSAPILRKTVSTSCMQDRRTCKPTTQTRSVAPAIKEEQQQQAGAPLIMVHNDDSGKPTSSPEAVIFPDRMISDSPGSPATPMSNLFPSHLSDEN